MTVTGSWASVYQFIDSLQHMDYAVSLKTVDLAVFKSPDLEKKRWQANITLTVLKNNDPVN
jgi:hypothetical protein